MTSSGGARRTEGVGQRIGQILVQKGFVSGPDLTTVLAEQLGVCWRSRRVRRRPLVGVKRRHPRGRGDENENVEPSKPARPPEDPGLRLALIDELDRRRRQGAAKSRTFGSSSPFVEQARGGARGARGNAAPAQGVPQESWTVLARESRRLARTCGARRGVRREGGGCGPVGRAGGDGHRAPRRAQALVAASSSTGHKGPGPAGYRGQPARGRAGRTLRGFDAQGAKDTDRSPSRRRIDERRIEHARTQSACSTRGRRDGSAGSGVAASLPAELNSRHAGKQR